jgi:hypothetical protein
MNDRLYEVMNFGSLSVVSADVPDLEWDDVNEALSFASDAIHVKHAASILLALSSVRLPTSGAWRPSVCLGQKGRRGLVQCPCLALSFSMGCECSLRIGIGYVSRVVRQRFSSVHPPVVGVVFVVVAAVDTNLSKTEISSHLFSSRM